MEKIYIGDIVELIYAENVYDLELGKIYKIREIFETAYGTQILVDDSENRYNLKRFRHDIKFIRKSKLDKLFNK
jgi:hypothetical protein